MPRPFRYSRQLAAVTLILYWALIALGTHLPGQSLEKVTVSDTWLHFGAYTGLSFLLCWCVLRNKPTVRTAAMILTIGLLYGAMDEVTQNWVPNRTADVRDWFADSLGTLAGMMAYFVSWWLVRLRQARRTPVWTGLPVNDAA